MDSAFINPSKRNCRTNFVLPQYGSDADDSNFDRDIDYCRTTPAQSVESEVDDRCRVERENLAHRAANCIAERLTHLGPGSAFDYERRSTLADVRYWHKADMPSCTAHVRYWGQSGHALLHCTCPLMTQSGHGRGLPQSMFESHTMLSS